jgi:hypothetical protein
MALKLALHSVAVTAALSCGSALAAETLTTIGGGAEYTTGNYGGTQKTEIFYLPFTAKFENGPWTLRATAPYIRITGPGNVLGVGADRVTVPGGGGQRRTESGPGDIVTSIFYTALSESRPPFGLDVGAKVKFGTAERDKGLGTGKTDYSVQADLFKPLGAITAFGSLGYRWYGDPPGINFRNVPYYALGAAYRVSKETTAGAVYDYRPRVVDRGSALSEATLYLSQRLAGNWKAQVYGVVGFADASPDWGAGFTLTYTY